TAPSTTSPSPSRWTSWRRGCVASSRAWGPEGMDGRTPEDPRTGYLRLRSLLFDRVTGLPSSAAVVEPVRDLLEGRRQVGVLHFQLLDLELVESLYGWQVFDRILARAAEGLKACAGRELPEGTVLALNAIAGDRLLAFV